MTDHYQIIDQIRSILHAGDHGRNGRLDGLASAYAAACDEATQRLGRCHRLLRQGLRSEAIQLAESAPNLLDTLAALDFPERAEWDEVVQFHDLTPAPKLPIEPARLLNEAYAEEDPLQDLLRRHRRLALQRAPLRSRIGVLRQLATEDPGNAIWSDDLRAFEAVRLIQIQEEATELLRHHETEAIGRLVVEVEQPDWSEPPPRALVQSLRKLDAQLRGERARGVLEDVGDRLDEAHNARDPIRGRLARQEWVRLANAVALPHDDPIAERVRPALDWLDNEDQRDSQSRRHEEDLVALGRLLDYPGAIRPAELERLAHAVVSHGHGMPDGLQQRYITRLQAAESAQTRRVRLIAAGSAAGVLLLGTLVYYAVRGQARAQEASNTAVAISDMLEVGELDHAVSLLKKLEAADPQLLTYPAMVAVRERVDLAENQESDRALRFDTAMREAESAPISVTPPPALESARSLARLDTEKAAVSNLVQSRAEKIGADQTQRAKELNPRLDEIGRAVDRIEKQAETTGPAAADESAILGPLADAQRTLAAVDPDVALAGAEVQDRARRLSDRLEAVRNRLDRRHLQSQLEEAITTVVAYSPNARGFTASTEYVAALESYIKSFPDLPRSRGFTETLRDQLLWNAVAQWDRLAAGWKGGQPAVGAREAKVRSEQCKQFLTQHPGSPDTDRVAAYQRAMEAVAHRIPDGDGALSKVHNLLTDLLVDNLWMVTVKPPFAEAARRYYLTQRPPAAAKSLRYLVGFDGKERTLKVVADWIERTDIAPQTKISARFKPKLFQEPAQIDWETVMVDLIDQIRNQPEIDPILQVALLRNVLQSAVEGSEPLRGALGGFKKQVDQADVDTNLPWMDPENAESERMRPKAAGFIRSLPDLTAARKEAAAIRVRLDRLLARHPKPIGWLARDAEGWQVRSGSVVPQEGTLWTIIPGEAGRGAWRKVGVINQAKPKLSLTDDPALAEGRPIFVTSADAEDMGP